MASAQKRIAPRPLKIALIGYGKMGKMVEKIALERGHTLVSMDAADICIDFTHPDQVVENIRKVASLKKPLVVGTTGWYERLPEVQKLVEQQGIGFLYSPNFAVGVSLFLKMVAEAARLMDPFDEFDVAVNEIHHNEKVDSPSGTAKDIGRAVLAHMQRKKKLTSELDGRLKADEVHISSMRCGYVPGTHSLIFDSPKESITLTHTARGREGFASGAVAAAEWLHGKTGFFTLQDMLGWKL